MPIAFEDLDRALLHAEVFVVEMQKQSALFFGPVGDNDCMTQLVKWMRQCFDWRRLAVVRPTVADVKAFVNLSEKLYPVLRQTFWPYSSTHPLVKRVWPSNESGEMGRQYMLLAKRVREVREKRPDLYASWKSNSMDGHMVLPLLVGGIVCRILLRFLWRRYGLEPHYDQVPRHGRVHRSSNWRDAAAVALERALHVRVAALICSFLKVQPEIFFASRGRLRTCGFMHIYSQMRHDS